MLVVAMVVLDDTKELFMNSESSRCQPKIGGFLGRYSALSDRENLGEAGRVLQKVTRTCLPVHCGSVFCLLMGSATLS